jgi:hypothetical protein
MDVSVGVEMIKHPHYYKRVEGLTHIDVYRVLLLFGVVDPCIQHAVKKLLVAGGRGAGKNIERDVNEAIDSLNRYLQIQAENCNIPPEVVAIESGQQ